MVTGKLMNGWKRRGYFQPQSCRCSWMLPILGMSDNCSQKSLYQFIDTLANINLRGEIFHVSFLPPQTDIFKDTAKIVQRRKLEKNTLLSTLKYFSLPVYEEPWFLPAAEQRFSKGASLAHVLPFFDLPVEISFAFLNLQALKKKKKSQHLTAEAFQRCCGASVMLLWLRVPHCRRMLSTESRATGMLLTIADDLCSLQIWELASPGILKLWHPMQWGGASCLARRQKWKNRILKRKRKKKVGQREENKGANGIRNCLGLLRHIREGDETRSLMGGTWVWSLKSLERVWQRKGSERSENHLMMWERGIAQT